MSIALIRNDAAQVTMTGEDVLDCDVPLSTALSATSFVLYTAVPMTAENTPVVSSDSPTHPWCTYARYIVFAVTGTGGVKS